MRAMKLILLLALMMGACGTSEDVATMTSPLPAAVAANWDVSVHNCVYPPSDGCWSCAGSMTFADTNPDSLSGSWTCLARLPNGDPNTVYASAVTGTLGQDGTLSLVLSGGGRRWPMANATYSPGSITGVVNVMDVLGTPDSQFTASSAP